MIFDENISFERLKIINLIKNKNRMEQDQIIGEWENGEI